MHTLSKIIISLLLTLASLNAVQVTASYWNKGQVIFVPIEVKLPKGWITQKSTSDTYPDAIFTSNRTVYMRLNIGLRTNQTAISYGKTQKQNGHSKHTIKNIDVFTKKETKRGLEFKIKKFVTSPEKISLLTSLYPYPKHKNDNLSKELLEAIDIIATAKILSFPTSKVVNSKIASSKKSVDQSLATIKTYAKAGKSRKFPSTCAKVDSRLLKYTYPNAPKEVYDYYDHAKNICYGKLHTIALSNYLKNKGKSVCPSIEVTLQINHIKSKIKKTNDIQIWNSFMKKYRKVCPNNMNF